MLPYSQPFTLWKSAFISLACYHSESASSLLVGSLVYKLSLINSTCFLLSSSVFVSMTWRLKNLVLEVWLQAEGKKFCSRHTELEESMELLNREAKPIVA